MVPTATFETFKAELSRLVAQFSRQQPYYTGPDYNEAKLREDFLNPFFAALGWDVGNRKGLIHTEREVDIEVRTEISGKQKRADYVFRIARLERLTCEAKKPAETLHGGHAYQAKRDAYARSIPLALLSDFEEIFVYVVGSRPHRSESINVGLWKRLHFTGYLDSAAELWGLLAYENVQDGSIDRLIDALPKRAARLKARQGYLIRPDRTKSLDAEFLNFLDESRQRLGSDLLKHNDRDDLLLGNHLNEAAQRILDRLVFLRICEDRGIDTGTLLSTQLREWWHQQDARPRLKRGAFDARKTLLPDAVDEEPPSPRYAPPAEGGLYRAFIAHVRALDQRPPSYQPFFNGQLFKPHFSEDLVVGDEWLANIIDDLTSDDEGYNFADIKVEILGSAYERFLGKVLRPQGRGATIEEKPEVRKAGGVYYTPRYIVDYIVEQTVGRQLEGKTPAQVAKLRFLDPACGSGSFLIRVYERVMEHYLRVFTERVREFGERAKLTGEPLDKLLRPHREDYYLDAAGNVRLTTSLKRQILQNNVFGVDIDAQAVEVTQLSLYLKMLEGENRESIYLQTKDLFNKEALLPALDQNIKCGNSLIASDFSLDPAELVRVNAFDWDIGFDKIMDKGGFDAVVGNPPYGASIDDSQKKYLRANYTCQSYQLDSYLLFMEKAIKSLLKPGRIFGMIIPNPWLTNVLQGTTRKFVCENSQIHEIVHFRYPVFEDATVDTEILILVKESPTGWQTTVRIVDEYNKSIGKLVDLPSTTLRHAQDKWLKANGEPINIFINEAEEAIALRLMSDTCRLDELCDINVGIKPYQTGKGTPPQSKKTVEERPFDADEKITKDHRLYLRGSDINRYIIAPLKKRYISFGPWLAEPRQAANFDAPIKIFIRQTGDSLIGTLDTGRHLCLNNMHVLVPKSGTLSPKYLLGVINSRLLNWYYQTLNPEAGEALAEVKRTNVARLPIKNINPSDSTAKMQHDRLVALVDKISALKPSILIAKSDTERAALQNAIRKTDRDIDKLVYELYGLTPEEIALVEGTAETPAAETAAAEA